MSFSSDASAHSSSSPGLCHELPSRAHTTEKRQTAYYSIAFQRSLLFSLLRWALSQKNRPLIYSLACILLKTTSFFTFTMLPVCWLRLTANICNLPVWTSACGGVPWQETGSSAQIRPGCGWRVAGHRALSQGFWQSMTAASGSSSFVSCFIAAHVQSSTSAVFLWQRFCLARVQ